MSKKRIFFIIHDTMKKLISLLLLCTGCASYNASTLSTITSHYSPICPVVVAAKEFTKKDCARYLDRDVIAHGYQPVQLCIQNNTNRRYLFTLDKVSLPIARVDEVADKVHTSTVGRVVGYSAAAVLTTGLFLIPAIIDGVSSAEANDKLDHDFYCKAAKDQIIPPYSTANMLLFVPLRGYQNCFDVTLMNYDTGQFTTYEIAAY